MSPDVLRRLAACAALAVALLALGCHPRTATRAARPPRGDEAELAVYVQPMASTPLALEIASVSATRRDGPPVPLALKLSEVSSATADRQRLLAAGRIPAGRYTGLLVEVRRARLTTGDLALPEGPFAIAIEFPAPAGRGQVLLLDVRREGAVTAGALLGPSPFTAERPDRPAPPLIGLASLEELEAVAVLDRRAHRVVGLLPTSPEPQEIAIDEVRQIAYVASAGGNRIEAFDLATFDPLVSTRLRVADRPASLGLVPDGTLLAVANAGSDSVSLVDPLAGEERQRIDMRGEPVQVLLDRPGRRAFVVLRRGGAVATFDLGGQLPVGGLSFGASPDAGIRTIPVEDQPVRALVSPAGDRLFVAYAHAPFVTVHSLPAGASLGRIFTGPGVTALLRDPVTGFLVVASSEPRLQIHDPATLVAIDSIALPAPASRLAVDAAEMALLALMPDRGSVAVIDLRRRRIRAEFDVGAGARDLALVGAAR